MYDRVIIIKESASCNAALKNDYEKDYLTWWNTWKGLWIIKFGCRVSKIVKQFLPKISMKATSIRNDQSFRMLVIKLIGKYSTWKKSIHSYKIFTLNTAFLSKGKKTTIRYDAMINQKWSEDYFRLLNLFLGWGNFKLYISLNMCFNYVRFWWVSSKKWIVFR